MRFNTLVSAVTLAALMAAVAPASAQIVLSESFDTGFITASTPPAGWVIQNNSSVIGSTTWFQGTDGVMPPLVGSLPTDYVGANFNSAGDDGTISNWLITPQVSVPANGSLSFYTRTIIGTGFPDRLEVRTSNGASTDVGSSATSVGTFTSLLLTINSALNPSNYPNPSDYPESWTQFTYTFPSAFDGRIAFRYFVPSGGPLGTNSNYIGIDELTISEGAPPSDITDSFVNKTASGSNAAANAPRYNRPVADGSGLSGVGTAVAYDVIEFTVPTAGPYTISVTPEASFDAFVVLYEGSFNPNDPLSTFYSAQDLGFAGGVEILDGFLVPGTSYYVVTSGFDNFNIAEAVGSYSLVINGPGLATIAGVGVPGDYNGDGFVDSADYTVWADHFGQTGSGIPGDGNGDGVVDSADYTVWADNFGQGTPPGAVAVPEPAAMGLLALGLPLIARRRR